MQLIEDVKLDYSDVLIRPKRSRLQTRADVVLTRTFHFPHSPQTWTGIPLVASNMDTIGTFAVANVLGKYRMLTCLHKFITMGDEFNSVNADYLAISSGTSHEDIMKLLSTTQEWPYIPFVCLDVANGYSEQFFTAIEEVRAKLPKHILIAGNVATPEAGEQSILSGADVVKVGIGPGKACSTRMVTGVGYPQLSAVIETADAVHGLGGHVMADGGCETPADVAKAFCGGADFVMLGSMFAGHEETGTEFYGMSSVKAQKKYFGEVKEYRASEGLELQVEPKGKLEDMVKQILGGIRSCCTYIGATEIKHMPKCATFVRVNRVK